jgi:hypothetical protein
MRSLGALGLAAAAAAAACGGAVREAAVVVVDVPVPKDEPAPAATAEVQCPPDTVREGLHCVRVLASPEIPAWQPPVGHGDPCATWTSADKAMFDCDEQNEHARDGGALR